MIYTLFVFNSWMDFALRIALAAIFMSHGWPKLKNLNNTGKNLEAMGIRPGKFWGTLVALLESVGGAMLLIGAGTQILGILFAAEMVVTIAWKIRRGEKLIGGYEFDLILLAASLIMATSGGGVFGLDSYFRIW